MSERKTIDEYNHLFSNLKIKNFDADLPKGLIRWLNEEGEVVAHAKCKPIISWAAGNQSMMWTDQLEHFTEAGIESIAKLDSSEAYRPETDEATAKELATTAALFASAEFLYDAALGGGNKLFLAIFDFTLGLLAMDENHIDEKIVMISSWIGLKIGSIASDPQPEILRSVADEISHQAKIIAPHTEADDFEGIATQLREWASALPEEREQILYKLQILTQRFQAEA